MTDQGFKPMATLLDAPETLANKQSEFSQPADEAFECDVCHDAGWVRQPMKVISAVGDGRLESRATPCPACRQAPNALGIPEGLTKRSFADFDLSRNPKMKPAIE